MKCSHSLRSVCYFYCILMKCYSLAIKNGAVHLDYLSLNFDPPASCRILHKSPNLSELSFLISKVGC